VTRPRLLLNLVALGDLADISAMCADMLDEAVVVVTACTIGMTDCCWRSCLGDECDTVTGDGATDATGCRRCAVTCAVDAVVAVGVACCAVTVPLVDNGAPRDCATVCLLAGV